MQRNSLISFRVIFTRIGCKDVCRDGKQRKKIISSTSLYWRRRDVNVNLCLKCTYMSDRHSMRLLESEAVSGSSYAHASTGPQTLIHEQFILSYIVNLIIMHQWKIILIASQTSVKWRPLLTPPRMSDGEMWTCVLWNFKSHNEKLSHFLSLWDMKRCLDVIKALMWYRWGAQPPLSPLVLKMHSG